MHCYLTEFDSSPGIIEPGQLIQPVPGFPQFVIAPFTGELLHQLAEMPGARQIAACTMPILVGRCWRRPVMASRAASPWHRGGLPRQWGPWRS